MFIKKIVGRLAGTGRQQAGRQADRLIPTLSQIINEIHMCDYIVHDKAESITNHHNHLISHVHKRFHPLEPPTHNVWEDISPHLVYTLSTKILI